MTIGERIRKLRESKNMTQTELAETLGMKTYTTVSKWESDDNFPKGKDIARLSSYFNVSSDYILGLESFENKKEQKESNVIYYNVPILGYSSCGFGTENNGEVTDYFEIPSDLIKGSPDDYFCVYAEGNSMIDAHIPSGALMIFKKQIEALDGVILACMVNNEAYTKRYRQIGTLPMLFSENSREDYEPIVITKDTEFSVHGKLEKVIIDF